MRRIFNGMKTLPTEIITLDKIVGGGQAMGVLADGRKAFVWGGLPGERVEIQITKKKSKLAEGVVTEVIEPSNQRVDPKDPQSYLSTSPWQIMSFDAEQHYKSALVEEAFELHDIVLPGAIEMYSDDVIYGYRNKVEFSWWWDNDTNQLDLAFFRRGTHGKIPVEGSSLARPEINKLALSIRDLLRAKDIEARSLKTLMIRCNAVGNCVWQLYVTNDTINWKNIFEHNLNFPRPGLGNVAQGGEVIYSDPKSPASRITKRLTSFGNVTLSDEILGTPFRYATESFFQVNIPVYEQALRDMKQFVETDKVIDLYSGVGSIGLTIGGVSPTLIEIDENAVSEMKRNIEELGSSAHAVLAPSEKALDYLTHTATVIVDPPRAGLHADVIDKLLDVQSPRIIYLSCNPVTQARDVAMLAEKYGVKHHRGYNFFPRTPHIEHLVVLDLK